jgi:hypothetical protein
VRQPESGTGGASAVRFPLHAPGSTVENLAIVNDPKDFDETVSGDTVKHQVPRLANTVSRGNEASS